MEPYAQQLKVWLARRQKIKTMRDRGWTLQRIASFYGISRQRVAQLLNEKQQ
jgi:transcriptional regulator with XRE-family HTH domain